MDLAADAYKLTEKMPKSEAYGFVSQIRRSAASVPANIAEGYGRGSTGSYAYFLRTARGSVRELETHVLLAERVGLVELQPAELFIGRAERVGKMLHGLISSIETPRSDEP
jgi:four helix bundle protein